MGDWQMRWSKLKEDPGQETDLEADLAENCKEQIGETKCHLKAQASSLEVLVDNESVHRGWEIGKSPRTGAGYELSVKHGDGNV